jgi:hypothetical protein
MTVLDSSSSPSSAMAFGIQDSVEILPLSGKVFRLIGSAIV